jgi:streptogramin lyase
MLVKTDIPTALAVASDGAVWFTIEFSDAIAVFRNGKIERFPKGTQNLEPLGLGVDAAGAAWYTDTPVRAISRISPDGSIRSFSLSTPIVNGPTGGSPGWCGLVCRCHHRERHATPARCLHTP